MLDAYTYIHNHYEMSDSSRVDNDTFFKKAEEFLKFANEKQIAVHFTVKRLVERDEVEGNLEFNTTENPKFDISKESSIKTNQPISELSYKLLVRISYGSHTKKVKCSTTVNSIDLNKFWKDYSTIIKSNIDGLIKKKKKKSKGKQGKK